VVFPENDEDCGKQPAFTIPFKNAVLQKCQSLFRCSVSSNGFWQRLIHYTN